MDSPSTFQTCRFAPVVAIGALTALLAACTADLRPPTLTAGPPDAAAEAAGRAWVDKMQAAHGGADAWRAHRDLSVELRDAWPSWLVRTFAMPWPEDGQKMRVDQILGTDDVRIEFMDGPWRGRTWGVQSWLTWSATPGGEPVFEPDDAIKFWAPTVAYFLALPLRIGEATVVAYGGEATVRGRPHAVVFASWGTALPQDAIDQYVLYIDAETHWLTACAYTVRDMAGSITGAVFLDDARVVQGIPFAHRLTMVGGPDDEGSVTHRFDIDSVRFGTGRPESWFRPAPGRVGRK